MKYTKGKIGRIFLVKFEDDDILTDKIAELARKEKIKAGVLVFLGALKKGKLVTGPKKPVIVKVRSFLHWRRSTCVLEMIKPRWGRSRKR